MKTKIILIIILAALLRIWNISSIPPHLSPDEAALGYNAYSLLETGRDEHGEPFPLIFKSFGDHKPGLYVYLVAPFIKVLGLTEFAVRLPSALAGVLAVYLVYLLCRRLQFGLKNIEYYAAFLLAINPWHMVFSRGAWEANIALTLTLAGLYFFMYSLEKQKYLIFSAIAFGLTLITYQGAKMTTIITLGLCALFYYQKVLRYEKKILFASALIGVMFLVPVMASFMQGQTGRLSVVSVFSSPRSEEYIQDFISESGVVKDSIMYEVFYNEPLNFLRGILGRYFNHYSGRFLFVEGDWQNPMFSPPYHGMLTIADSILVVTGGFLLLKKLPKKQFLFICLWLFLTPLPAVLSRDQIQAVRALHMVIPLTIVLAFGLWWVMNHKWKLIKFVFAGAYALSYIYFIDAYFVHFPQSRSNLWGYGYKEIVQTIEPLQQNYNRIKIEQSFAQPYMYYLFYTAYDPSKYQLNNNFKEGENGDVGMVTQLDKIYFGDIHHGIDLNEKGVVVSSIEKIPMDAITDNDKFTVIKKIEYPRGASSAGFIVFTVNPNENQ